MKETIKKQGEKMIEQLLYVKDEFIKQNEIIKASIRKDIVATELKDILYNNHDFYSLKEALETYINQLNIKEN